MSSRISVLPTLNPYAVSGLLGHEGTYVIAAGSDHVQEHLRAEPVELGADSAEAPSMSDSGTYGCLGFGPADALLKAHAVRVDVAVDRRRMENSAILEVGAVVTPEVGEFVIEQNEGVPGWLMWACPAKPGRSTICTVTGVPEQALGMSPMALAVMASASATHAGS
jgi:hypothetical protein